MRGSSSGFLGKLRVAWRSLAPERHAAESSVERISEWRTDFNWRGSPLTFDRRRGVVLRDGRVFAKVPDIRAVEVTHVRDDDGPDYWKVSFNTGLFSGVEIGRTRDDVEASIAAARVSTVAGVAVRSMSIHLR